MEQFKEVILGVCREGHTLQEGTDQYKFLDVACGYEKKKKGKQESFDCDFLEKVVGRAGGKARMQSGNCQHILCALMFYL